MLHNIDAIYDQGVFCPAEPISLPFDRAFIGTLKRQTGQRLRDRSKTQGTMPGSTECQAVGKVISFARMR
jgi:hypothetical protein